jgi:Na+-driven multidrug efflux pump
VFDIMTFGISQFLLQFVMSSIQLIFNMSMGWYGAAALGPGGGDTALSGLNINMSVSMMILMPVFGINQGAQPVLGYNYGAKQYGRVRHALLLAIAAATAICVVGFVLAEIFPDYLVRIFTPEGSPELFYFAPRAMRTMMIFLPLNGFQIVATNFFVVTGRPRMSIFLSMLRQCILLLPCILIFGRIWGLWGVIGATPVADGFSVAITGIMTLLEIRKLKAAAPLAAAHHG